MKEGFFKSIVFIYKNYGIIKTPFVFLCVLYFGYGLNLTTKELLTDLTEILRGNKC